MAGILSASERAKALISQILTFSQKKEIVSLPMDVRDVVKEAVLFLRASLPATVLISLEIPPVLPFVNGDPSQIHQVILNLATNGAQAMNQTGPLEIYLAQVELGSDSTKTSPDLRPGTYVRLRVTDTGSGIRPDLSVILWSGNSSYLGAGKEREIGVLSPAAQTVQAKRPCCSDPGLPGQSSSRNRFRLKGTSM